MTPRPRHPKPDANQAAIIAELERLGFFVQNVSSLATLGFDLLVWGWHPGLGRPLLLAVEVKSPGGTLTDRERAVMEIVTFDLGDSAPYLVAWNTEDILDWFTRL